MDRETTLLTDRAVQFATAENWVFSDFCLGGIGTDRVKAMRKQDQMVFGIEIFRKLNRIDGEQMEFEW